MRRLLLSSNGSFIIEKGFQLLFDDPLKIKLVYIPTAGNVCEDKAYITIHKRLMKSKGYNFTELDIAGKNEKELREELRGADAIHVEGGNTFYLLKAVKESGFDKIIKELIKKGVTYIGSSAGSYIACPTIETSTWKKPGEEKDKFGLTDLTAMNLVPFILRVHYKPDEREFLKEKIAQSKYDVKILPDGQAILVEDDNYKLIGEGEEI